MDKSQLWSVLDMFNGHENGIEFFVHGRANGYF